MNLDTLKSRVASGIVCLSLAVIGISQSHSDVPVILDGNAPRMTSDAAEHLDEVKMSNPILSSLDL